MKTRLAALLAALWWGSLTAIGFLAVPMLFAHMPTPALAGNMAAKLFAAQTWVAVVCCMVLLMLSNEKGAFGPLPWARGAMVFIVGGLLLALLVEFGVAPRIVARRDLRLWHSLGTVMYALQWGCALAVLWRILKAPSQSES